MGSQKGQKNIVIKELEQIWNNADASTIVVASTAVPILEQHKRFCARNLSDFDL